MGVPSPVPRAKQRRVMVLSNRGPRQTAARFSLPLFGHPSPGWTAQGVWNRRSCLEGHSARISRITALGLQRTRLCVSARAGSSPKNRPIRPEPSDTMRSYQSGKRSERDSNPRYRQYQYNGLAIRPSGNLSPDIPDNYDDPTPGGSGMAAQGANALGSDPANDRSLSELSWNELPQHIRAALIRLIQLDGSQDRD